MTNCKICEHWDTKSIEPSYDGEFVGDMRKCLFLSGADGMDFAHPILGDAGINTSPEFGCIIFKEKAEMAGSESEVEDASSES